MVLFMKTSPLNLQINVYTLSIINKGQSDSKVEQIFKIENHYSNSNHVCTIFKGTLM